MIPSQTEPGTSTAHWAPGSIIVYVLISLAGLAGFSFPGLPWVTIFPGLVLIVAALVMIVSRRPRSRSMRRTRAWWWPVLIPLAALAIAVSPGPNLAVRARFAVSHMWFQAVVERADAQLAGADRSSNTEVKFLDCPHLIGSYLISDCAVLDNGYVFEDPFGNALVDFAGFAYLPSGPTTDLSGLWFDSPNLHHLQGDWYSYDAGF